LTHHSWENRPNVLWISEELPQYLIPIGTIAPTAEEQAIPCASFGGWTALTLHPLAQWRWDNEREAVAAEDTIKQKNEEEAREKARREREEYLKLLTLEELRERPFFPTWEDYPSPQATRASRGVMTATVEELLALGPRASEEERVAILQRCIESFNELDAKMHFIKTVEREDICEEFEAVVHACGLGAHKDLADRWRAW
jgi:hypothetical protein